MKVRASNFYILSILTLAVLCGGCSYLHLPVKSDSKVPTSTDSGKSAADAVPGVAGYWQLDFTFNGNTLNANMHVNQDKTHFTGEGTEDPSGREFSIVDGEITGDQVYFAKKYPAAPPDAPPIEYIGTLKTTNQGPYMSGEYTTLLKGQKSKGQWEALMSTGDTGAPPQGAPGAPGAGAPDAQQPAQNPAEDNQAAPPQPDNSKAPDLSGKWKLGYEFNFKTIKSTMFLEQDAGKLSGHGTDENTKEKFIVDKGWYKFPKITLIRKYEKGKGAAANRTMIFKGDVSNVSDKDYQGPYMTGKTQGGGQWEAEMVK